MTQFLLSVLTLCGLYFCSAYSVSSKSLYPVDKKGCCGTLKKFAFPRCLLKFCYNLPVWRYYPTRLENMGLCLRKNSMYFSVPYHRKPNPLPGRCMCKKEALRCFSLPTIEAATAKPTAVPEPETASPEPTTAEPTASFEPETTSPEPTTEPTSPEPPTTELTSPEPTTTESTSPEPTTTEPTTSPEPTTTESITSPEPTTEKPTTSPEQTTTEPTTSPESSSTEPITSPEPTTTKPTTSSEPTTTEPTTSPEPVTTEPTSPEPTTTEPTTSPEPTTEPATSPEPATTEPITSEPTTAEPTTSLETTEPTASLEPVTSVSTASLEPETTELTASLGPETEESTAATTKVTTLTTTQPVTTTSLPVCPLPPTDVVGRILEGTAVDKCNISAVLSFWVDYRQTCNGVLGYNATSQTHSIYLTEFCMIYMQYITVTDDAPAFGLYDKVNFPVKPATDFTVYPNHLATMAPPGLLSQSECKPTSACLYDPDTMSDLINFSSCYIASYGSNIMVKKVSISTGALDMAEVAKHASCTTKPATGEGSIDCFVAVKSYVRNCWGDNGAPVFCHLTGSGEEVLYGLVDVIQPENKTENSMGLCATSEFHVLPIS